MSRSGQIDLDWTDPEPTVAPGVYHAEVSSSELRYSQAGDAMLVVGLRSVEGDRALCKDRLMLAGRGRYYGMQKLLSFGIEKGQKAIEAQDLVGKRVYVALALEEYRGEKRLAVNTKAPGMRCGYAPDGKPPTGVSLGGGPDAEDYDDAPF